MPNIGMIGPRDQVLCYMAVGFTVYPADASDPVGAEQILKKAAAECAVLYLTPELSAALAPAIERYAGAVTPAILTLPTAGGGMGTAALKAAVERAVGADIIFRE